jgi:CheY-like chemotaxis protein
MASCSVLVVDDDPAIRDVIAEILHSEGYRVLTAANGAVALRLLEQQRPALVLLDMQMPVLDGWGFAARIRSWRDRPPIVVMTAGRDAYRWCREIGADDCLPKPFDLETLLGLVARHCQGQRYRRTADSAGWSQLQAAIQRP